MHNNYRFIKNLTTTSKITDRNGDRRDPIVYELNAPTVFYSKLGNLLPGKSNHLTPGSAYPCVSILSETPPTPKLV